MSTASTARPPASFTRLAAELGLVQSLLRGTLARRAGLRAGSLGADPRSGVAQAEAEALLFELDLSEEVETQFDAQLSEVEQELEASHFARGEPVSRLREAFALSRRELTVWMLCAAPQLDHRYGRLYGLVVDDLARCHGSEELLQTVLSIGSRTQAQLRGLLLDSAPLRALGLVQVAEHKTCAGALVQVPAHLVDYVLGVAELALDPPPADTKARWPLAWQAALDSFWHADGSLRAGPHHVVGCADDALEILAGVAARAQLEHVIVDLRGVSSEHMRACLQRAGQLAVLRNLALTVVLPEPAAETPRAPDSFLRMEIQRDLARLARLLPLCATVGESMASSGSSSRLLPLPRLESSDRRLLWKGALLGRSPRANHDIPLGLSELPLGPSAIARVARDFRGAQVKARDEHTLLARARAALPPLPARLAMPVLSQFGWNDLVVADELRERLKELCTLFTQRDRVLHDWGFAAKLPYGRSISALFTGAPGTGKTMAASIVANQLGLACYRVDLAALVSKYIGETEKNLAELFDAAERSHVVLLFDEADALFGKRTQAKSANDRYANLETSYLLQRVESYSGVVILTTNLRQNIDSAFTRRLRLVANFPFPLADMRRHLWRSSLPPGAPLADDVDLGLLSERIELAGGPIKNAVLAAACRASAASRPICMDDLLDASKHELRAAGQAIFRRDFELESSGAAT